jgi:hypothetical protein
MRVAGRVGSHRQAEETLSSSRSGGLAEADAFEDPDRLPVRVHVPGGAGTGCRVDAARAQAEPSEGAAMVSR